MRRMEVHSGGRSMRLAELTPNPCTIIRPRFTKQLMRAPQKKQATGLRIEKPSTTDKSDTHVTTTTLTKER